MGRWGQEGPMWGQEGEGGAVWGLYNQPKLNQTKLMSRSTGRGISCKR